MKSKVKIKKRRNPDGLTDFETVKSRQGLKSSRKRSVILDHFFKKDRHYSAEELYAELKKRCPGISYSTVYRALKLLADSGLAAMRRFEKGIARFEPVHKSEHHDHLICLKCGRIIEFTDYSIERRQDSVCRMRGFKVRSHRLELYGLCRNCRRNKHGRR